MKPESRKFVTQSIECAGQMALLALGIFYVGPHLCTCRAIAVLLLSVYGVAVAINLVSLISDYRKFRSNKHVILSQGSRQRYFDRIIEERRSK